jgi:hypothetical protein
LAAETCPAPAACHPCPARETGCPPSATRHWYVCRWLAGENAIIERIADLRKAAITLAPFVAALERIDPTGGPPLERTTLAAACRSQSSKKSSAITNTPLDHEPARLAQTVICAAKTRSIISAGWRIAKKCCVIEAIGDTFVQCLSATPYLNQRTENRRAGDRAQGGGMQRSGRLGGSLPRGSHGSGHADFPHPALRSTALLRDGGRTDARLRQRIVLQQLAHLLPRDPRAL